MPLTPLFQRRNPSFISPRIASICQEPRLLTTGTRFCLGAVTLLPRRAMFPPVGAALCPSDRKRADLSLTILAGAAAGQPRRRGRFTRFCLACAVSLNKNG
jgi:hypothetical protein